MQIQDQKKIIKSIHVDSRNPCNNSLHDAVTAEIAQPMLLTERVNKLDRVANRIVWERADTEKYRTVTEEKLTILMDQIEDGSHPELVLARINKILAEAGLESDPKAMKKRTSKKKHTWCRELQPYIKESKVAHWNWK